MSWFRKKTPKKLGGSNSSIANKTTNNPLSLNEAESWIKDYLKLDPNLVIRYAENNNKKVMFCFLNNISDQKMINELIIPYLNDQSVQLNLKDLKQSAPIADTLEADSLNKAVKYILQGWTYLLIEDEQKGLLLNTVNYPTRSLSTPEIESLVLGPQLAFNEKLDTNIALIRKYISDSKLSIENFTVGKKTHTRGAVIYLDGVADDQNVQKIMKRINEVEIDGVIGTAMLVQLIEDNSISVLPNVLETERPDRVVKSILDGKIAVLLDGGTNALICPSRFIDFFQSNEDYYVRWNMATFLRIVRMFATVLSILFTPLYVAALTFHYEIIPQSLLLPLAETRTKVPFPPLFEALLLEFIIELLREAGARLPTKVGQTIGIVGGIVIGQAAVQAGFTSNILIMIVALGALSSFTTPSYLMGTAIRIIRFPMIILAGMYGLIGISVGVIFFLIHLIRQTSIGSPYLEPIYPLRFNDLKDSFVRMPYTFFLKRPEISRSNNEMRLPKKKVKKDIDE